MWRGLGNAVFLVSKKETEGICETSFQLCVCLTFHSLHILSFTVGHLDCLQFFNTINIIRASQFHYVYGWDHTGTETAFLQMKATTHPLRQSLSSHPHSSRLAPCPKVRRWVKTTQIRLLLQEYTLSACWSWGTVPDTPGYTAENQVKPPPSYTPFLSPLRTSPLLLGTSRSTAESSVPWQSGVGRRMFLSLWPMALDHVGPEAVLFGCCELTWPFVNASLSVSSTKSQNQWGSQSQGGRLKPSCPSWSLCLSPSYSFFNQNPKAAIYINWCKHTLWRGRSPDATHHYGFWDRPSRTFWDVSNTQWTSPITAFFFVRLFP